MRRSTVIWSMMLAAVLAGAAAAEEIEIFRASVAGEEAWVWGDARLKIKGDKLQVSEANKKGDFGDVFLADHLPYLPDGVIELDVTGLSAGDYTLQVLGFKGAVHVDTVDAVKKSAQLATHTIPLSKLPLSEGVNEIVFKLWIAGAEGASVWLRDLVYTLHVADEKIALDDRFDNKARWTEEGTILSPSADGAMLTPKTGADFGALLHADYMSRDDNAVLLIHAPQVQNGSMTVQLVEFDEAGTYLESMNAIKDLGSGMHAVRLGSLPWNAQASQYTIKLWLGGGRAARARLKRLMVITP